MINIFKSKLSKVIAVTLIAVLVTLFLIGKDVIKIGGSSPSVGTIHKKLAGQTLNCTIILDKNLNTASPGLKFATDLIRKFAQQHHCEVNISVERNRLEKWDEIITGTTNFLIYNTNDSIPAPYPDYTEHSLPVEGGYACYVKLGDDLLLDNLNYFLTRYKQTSEYQKLWSNTKKSLSRGRFGLGLTRYSISQYDNIVKKYSKLIDWDWRLLSALIYQESKFNQGVISRMGAIGLMQVMESTAKRLGFDDVYNPEENIHAGVLELRRLIRRYTKMGAEEDDIILLVLAAYNCGDGKVQHFMKMAENNGDDPLKWENLKHYASRETIVHVDVIMRQYELYCSRVEQ